MSPRAKLRITGALFWAALLSLIVLGTRLHADEGRGHERDRDRDDERNECLVPEANTYTAAIVLGVGLIGFALWKQHQRRNGR